MWRFSRLLAPSAALAVALFAGPAVAQPRAAPDPPFAAVALQDSVPSGMNAAIALRIVDLRTQAPSGAARIASARLLSPFGAEAPVRVEPPSAGPGLRVLRADLLSPGTWSLELALAGPGGALVRTSVDFTVTATPPTAPPVDPAGASLVAGDVAVSPLSAAALAGSGPGALGQTAAPAQAGVATGDGAPPTAAARSSFCAECAAQAPH